MVYREERIKVVREGEKMVREGEKTVREGKGIVDERSEGREEGEVALR